MKPSNCPIECDCPSETKNNKKPLCANDALLIRDGCDCCWMCARQSGESCSTRYKCDSASGLDCFYQRTDSFANSSTNMQFSSFAESESDSTPSSPDNWQSRVQLTTTPPNPDSVGSCWKRYGKPCLVNGTWLAHSGVQTNGCRHHCVCVDGLLLCSDRCLTEEQQRPPDVLCQQPDPEGSIMQLQLMPPAPGECCRRWMCVTVAVRQDKQPIHHSQSLENFESRTEMNAFRSERSEQHTQFTDGLASAECTLSSRQSATWSACSQTCGLGLSSRWTTETQDCRNVTETRLCFWRPCRTFRTQKNKIFVPTLKFSRPGYLKFTTLRSDPADASNFVRSLVNLTDTIDKQQDKNQSFGNSANDSIEPVVCQLERSFQPRFCNQPEKDSCCWPSRSKTRRLRFRCTGGRIVYHLFEWIISCQCSAVSCSVALTGNNWENKFTDTSNE